MTAHVALYTGKMPQAIQQYFSLVVSDRHHAAKGRKCNIRDIAERCLRCRPIAEYSHRGKMDLFREMQLAI